MNRIVKALMGLLFSTVFAQAQLGVPYPLSQDEILLVQAQLYQLNYDVELDGKLGPATIAEITAWQANTGRPTTGFLTQEEYDFILAYDTSGFWGSIAASTDGAIHVVWYHTARIDSETSAIRRCKRASLVPDECFVVSNPSYSVEQEAWVAAVLCSTNGSSDKFVAMVAGNTESEARIAAFEFAESEGYTDKCEIRAVVEARGRHK